MAIIGTVDTDTDFASLKLIKDFKCFKNWEQL